ncbi:ABC transporter ATP-binding protein [Engelhardtia mirabilis]|uniref:Lipoprotein-releasing system ATP-binding protein LolD n=1 Tax=Engelhardtia mirabilis TaxID=2528011 RepID=A0A518BG33_9BACT|nr:Lipoprotein-releasing system ATP-binding protein LolD [Planctomycetes bacterium Pla133]QDV00270.1 Lipoprotein-releasing system ATP-binding protein LolD [Planctomycetes bacterium Pla86]
MALLELRDLKKSYRAPDGTVQVVLDVPEFTLGASEQVAMAGSSGSGKTTLLNAIAGILTPDSGSIRLEGTDLAQLSESQRDALRAATIGYVFQTFNLLQGYTALENVTLGMAFGPGPDRAFASELLARLGLGDRLDYRPRQLSVGQQQRVALARALANRPRLVLADEPTGNLDPVRALEALDMLRELCGEHGAALLLVSHDRSILDRFERVVDLAQINRAAAGAVVAGATVGGNAS